MSSQGVLSEGARRSELERNVRTGAQAEEERRCYPAKFAGEGSDQEQRTAGSLGKERGPSTKVLRRKHPY